MTQEPVAVKELNPTVPENLEFLIMKMLNKYPENRPTAQELEASLIDIQFQLGGTLIDITKQETQMLSDPLMTNQYKTTKTLEELDEDGFENAEYSSTQFIGAENKKISD